MLSADWQHLLPSFSLINIFNFIQLPNFKLLHRPKYINIRRNQGLYMFHFSVTTIRQHIAESIDQLKSDKTRKLKPK